MNVDSIFNRPPSVAEDTLQYALYPPTHQADKVSVTSLAASIKAYIEQSLPKFIWHRDAFEVKLAQGTNDSQSWFLEGRMRVGDSVDDEWCTVWLLRELSSQWDLVISVFDSDGEFLLIEAAEELPSWVKPTNSENRVWIHDSRLHLIPLSHISPPSSRHTRRKLPGKAESDDEGLDETEDDSFLSIPDAVRLVRDPLSDTFAPKKVQDAVWQRILEYPAAARTHLHQTKAYIPADIVRALRGNMSLIQRAVEAFYTRDGIQLRVAHRMSRFPPNTSKLTTVKMTRTAYAQLVGQKFFPPKIFGQWTEPEGSNERRWKDVGMKIAVGFEILYQESKSRHPTQNLSANGLKASMDAAKDALRRDAEYQKYIETLNRTSYFKGEVKDSEHWKGLEDKAAAVFLEVRNTDGASRESFSTLVDRALVNTQNLPDMSDEPEDDDTWLSIDAESFDQLLNNITKEKKQPSASDGVDDDQIEGLEDRVASEQARKLKVLAERVEQFVEGEGDLEGAQFEDEASDDDLLSEEEIESDDETSDETLEQDQQTLRAEKQAAMDELVPALDPAEYGQMPASYHSHSQRVAPTTIETDKVEEQPPAAQPSSVSTQEKSNTKPIRAPIIERDKYDGVDSDDETDEEHVEDEEEEEDKPQVVGEIEIDMGEEEEEFLEFSRQALGISDEQWSDIIKERQDRGAFLPESAKKAPKPMSKTKKMDTHDAPEKPTRGLQPGARPQANPELDSFEAVMQALDNVLSETREGSQTSKRSNPPPAPKGSDKGKRKATVEDEPMDVDDASDIEDIDAAMEAELKEALEVDSDADEPLDYTMIKNFLESYKSQAGLSGPVSNLAGRLQGDLKLPRDDS